jgi:SNF2 family DNA or RNA helicase
VPYYGVRSSRQITNKYELYHLGKQNKAEGLKAHVVLTTYDTVSGSEFRLFNQIPRWETVIVDEGQRLKADSSLMFTKLKQLNAVHRVLLTGTPLNNNLRELFNLLHFIDPANFTNLAELEERFEELNEGLVQELHDMLKPYILRRIKANVLKLPPKVEIIVPCSMTPA